MNIDKNHIQNWIEKVVDIEFLIDIYGEDILKGKIKGNTLLHIAIEKNDKYLFKQLMSKTKKYDFLNIENRQGLTPLRYSILKKRNNFFTEILHNKRLDISYEKKSNINNFIRLKPKKKYNNEKLIIDIENNNEFYKPSILNLLLVKNMEKEFYSAIPFFKDELFSFDISTEFSEFDFLSPCFVSNLEIAAFNNNLNIIQYLLSENKFLLLEQIKKSLGKLELTNVNIFYNNLLYYTSKDKNLGFSKKEIKHYPLIVFLQALQIYIGDEINNNHQINKILDKHKGSYFNVDDNLKNEIFSLLENIILNTATKKQDKVIKRRI